MKKNKGWYKPKAYLHISPKLVKADKTSVLKYIQTNLRNHHFFPLVHETLSTRRYKKLQNGDRSHFDYFSDDPKPTAKKREIFYPNHLDAHIYAYYAQEILGKQYEKVLKTDILLDQAVTAYRKIPINSDEDTNKCNIEFAKEVFDEIRRRKNCIVVCYDIENFFPSLNHEYLKACWRDLLGVERLDPIHFKIYESITKYSYVELDDIVKTCIDEGRGLLKKHDFISSKITSYFINAREFRKKIASKNLIKVNPLNHPNHKEPAIKERRGIPQGTPLSAFLANLYLLEFDRFIVENIVKQENCFYRRYSDDIVIIFNNEYEFEKWDKEVRSRISSGPFHLKINESKTIISRFKETRNTIACITKPENSKEYTPGIHLRYLGFDFDGNTILIKDASLSQYHRDIKMALRSKGNRVKKAQRLNLYEPLPKHRDTKLYLTKLIRRFTHLGKNKAKSNYLTYIDRSARTMYPDVEDFKQTPIRKQVRRSWSVFNKTADKYRYENWNI